MAWYGWNFLKFFSNFKKNKWIYSINWLRIKSDRKSAGCPFTRFDPILTISLGCNQPMSGPFHRLCTTQWRWKSTQNISWKWNQHKTVYIWPFFVENIAIESLYFYERAVNKGDRCPYIDILQSRATYSLFIFTSLLFCNSKHMFFQKDQA